jgi:hypothetical protein
MCLSAPPTAIHHGVEGGKVHDSGEVVYETAWDVWRCGFAYSGFRLDEEKLGRGATDSLLLVWCGCTGGQAASGTLPVEMNVARVYSLKCKPL